MFRVGLTGNIASGKSSVARVWARSGAPIIDADILAREAVAPGTPGLEQVRARFGEAVIRGDQLDRPALRRIVMADAAARERLEAIIHPEVARLREEAEARLAEQGAPLVVHDIPLLFEVGLQNQFDLLVLVDAPEGMRAERLARDRGLEPGEIRRLIAAQMPSEQKRARSDVVIDNTGTLEQLEREAVRVWEEIRERAGSEASDGAAAGNSDHRIRVDMHIHTRASFDSRNDPDAVVERAVEQGVDRVCITDHDELSEALVLAERHPGRVIPGEEVKTAERVDIIGLYLSEWIPGGTPARETCERIREQGGLVYVPHPFAGGKGGGGRILPEIEDLVDVVEGFNARLHDPSLNERAQAWARERALPVGAGSDAHTLGEVGRAWVELPEFSDTPSFLRALARGTIHGRASSRLVHIASTVAKLLP